MAKNQHTQRKKIRQLAKKLGIILENKVVPKLKLQNNVSIIKWSPKLNEKKNKQIPFIFHMEDRL